MKGRLIVIEGIDGSGKATQSAMLTQLLKTRGENVLHITFPDYANKSSTLVKMYLQGEFGDCAESVNAFAASSFYAVDRFASYSLYWRQAYLNGATIISDRYTSSNAVHQMAKLEQNQWNDYLDWLYDYEFNRLRIPKPDLVIYLDMSPELASSLIDSRYKGNSSRRDLHERDIGYMRACRQAAMFAAEKTGWKVIDCESQSKPLAIEQIHQKIMKLILNLK